jgi:anti-anti-sigma factor
MTSTISIPINAANLPDAELSGVTRQILQTEQAELTELVRGNEEAFLARLSPLVRRQSVTLDLSQVKRIDAAGIAALIALHAHAHEAGNCFSVVNPTPHVAEILSLVGLERILMSHIANIKSQSAVYSERPAA